VLDHCIETVWWWWWRWCYCQWYRPTFRIHQCLNGAQSFFSKQSLVSDAMTLQIQSVWMFPRIELLLLLILCLKHRSYLWQRFLLFLNECDADNVDDDDDDDDVQCWLLFTLHTFSRLWLVSADSNLTGHSCLVLVFSVLYFVVTIYIYTVSQYACDRQFIQVYVCQILLKRGM